ncbi:MAG: hypothetical protein AB7E61_02415 [Acholeplasmataceae bacterium]
MVSDTNTVKQKIVKVLMVILLVVLTNLLQLIIFNSETTEVDIQAIIQDALPTVIAVTMGIATILFKQGSFDKLFQSMLNKGQQTFNTSAAHVETVVKESLETRKDVKELKHAFKELYPKLDQAIKIKDSVDILNNKIDLLVTNMPELVKSGVATKIVSVGRDEG